MLCPGRAGSLDGKNQDVVRCCWAAADIFLSLVDNPQETHRSVEAMAAGVPLVVRWDGYRYTVTDGVEGFLIPTLAPARPSQGEELALNHDHGLTSYQDYVGSVAQHVAVDTEAAGIAVARPAEDLELRQRMGSGAVRPSSSASMGVARLHHRSIPLADRRRSGGKFRGELNTRWV